MARTKNKFLNAKPVTKAGGNSNGVRNPAKPYKPPAKPAKPAKPVKPAKPASNSRTAALKNHASAKPDARINTNNFLPNSKAKGINLPNAGANAVTGSTQGPNLKGTKPGTRPLPASTASQPNALSRNLRFGRGNVAAIALGAVNAADNARLTPAQRAKKNEVVNPDRGQNLLTKLQSGTLGQPNKPKPKQGNTQSRFAGARDRNLERINNDPRFAAPTPTSKPPTRPSASRPSQSTPSRSTASGSGSQRSASSQPSKPAMPGRKWEDFNPGRGTSQSNNPLLDRDSGGMKLRDRMKQREDAQRAESTKNLKNNFGQDSGYETKTKVDGSKYADKKPDMKKVNEYDRRKRRYYD